MTRALLLLLPLLCATPVFANEIACEGVFGKDATLADFETTFGKANVVTGEVPGPEGTTLKATTVFPNSPDKMFTVYWWDEEKQAILSGFTVPAGEVAPGGVTLGMDVDAVQALNGEPFAISGFYWDYGGSAGFESGKLSDLPGGCVLSLRFSPSVEDLPEDDLNAISGDRELRSDMPELAKAKPVVTEITVGYAAPEGMFD